MFTTPLSALEQGVKYTPNYGNFGEIFQNGEILRGAKFCENLKKKITHQGPINVTSNSYNVFYFVGILTY
jgi:hypothetical protein